MKMVCLASMGHHEWQAKRVESMYSSRMMESKEVGLLVWLAETKMKGKRVSRLTLIDRIERQKMIRTKTGRMPMNLKTFQSKASIDFQSGRSLQRDLQVT